MEVKILRLASTVLITLTFTQAFSQLLHHPELEAAGITLQYETDYQKVIKKNKVKRVTSTYWNGRIEEGPTYEYDTTGRITKAENLKWYDDGGYRKYDRLGRLIEKTYIFYRNSDSLKPVTNRVIKLKYDKRGKIRKSKNWYRRKGIYKRGNPLPKKTISNKTETFIYKNYYNEKDQIIKQQLFSADTFYGSYLYKYDDGRLTDLQIWWKDKERDVHYIFTYDSLGRLININETWEKYSVVTRDYVTVYNDKGQITDQHVIKGKDDLLERNGIVTYSPDGLIKTISTLPGEREDVPFIKAFKYEYYK